MTEKEQLEIEKLELEIKELKRKNSLSERWGNSFLFGAAAVTAGSILGGKEW